MTIGSPNVPPTAGPGAHSPPLVWVVDDNPRDAELARQALARECAVDVLLDGSAALERLATREPPDLLVLDWVMPGVSGIEVLRFLRSGQVRLPEIPVLLLTAHNSPQQVAESLTAGANDFLSKPFAPIELKARVGALLRAAGLLRRAQDAEEAVRRLLANAPDALLTVDANGRVRYANPEAARVFGRPAQELEGRLLDEMAPGMSRRTLAVAPGAPLVPLPDVAIGERLYAPSIRFLPGDDTTRTSIALRDVTELRRLERRRLDFFAILAHDVRSPLGEMARRTQGILQGRRGPISSELVEEVRNFDASIRSMVTTIGDILDLARLESGSQVFGREPLDLGALAERVVQDLQPLAEARRVELTLERGVAVAQVSGDRQRLSQACSYLLGTALDFSPQGGRLRVSLESAPGVVRAEVLAPRGLELPSDRLEGLFERFVHVPRQEGRIGSGMALMIVREIIASHGGRVGLEVEEGESCRLWFELPSTSLSDAARDYRASSAQSAP